MSCNEAEFMDINGCDTSAESSQNAQLVAGQSQVVDLPSVEPDSSNLMEVTTSCDSSQEMLSSLPEHTADSVVTDGNIDSNLQSGNDFDAQQEGVASAIQKEESKSTGVFEGTELLKSGVASSDVDTHPENDAAGNLCRDEGVARPCDSNIHELEAKSLSLADTSADSAGGKCSSDQVAISSGTSNTENTVSDRDTGDSYVESGCESKAGCAGSIDNESGAVEGTNRKAVNPEEYPAAVTVVEESSTIDVQSEDDAITADVTTVDESAAISDDPMLDFDFDEEGQLRDKDGKPFEFNVSDDHWRNQKRYERLGEAITEKIYDLLVSRCKLRKLNLPLSAKDDEPHSFIFMSDGAMTTFDRLMILIHGTGVVRAGQWARRLIINDDLNKGTQIPYIEKALRDGYEVIVLNTNLHRWPDYGAGFQSTNIPENDTPEAHATYVWENIVRLCQAQHVAIVAHSYGGIVTTHLLETVTEEFKKRVFAVAFTDSVHSCYHSPQEVRDFYKRHARNYVTSELPVGEPVSSYFGDDDDDAVRVSAGHTKHEWTSYSSFDAIFKYFEYKYKRRLEGCSDDEESASCTAV